jgi:hypothetical protein
MIPRVPLREAFSDPNLLGTAIAHTSVSGLPRCNTLGLGLYQNRKPKSIYVSRVDAGSPTRAGRSD